MKWAEEGETSSAYFCRLERKRAADRFIYSVDTPSGSTCTSVASLKAFRDFYADLFTSSRTFASDREEMINNLSNCLSADEREACEGLLTMKECLVALRGMVRGSAPGVDGFPMEFYLDFWDSRAGAYVPFPCHGLITLLLKGGY